MSDTARGSLHWLIAVIILLSALVLYHQWAVEDNSNILLVETDCGTILGEKDPTYQAYSFKVGLSVIRSFVSSGTRIYDRIAVTIKIRLNKLKKKHPQNVQI